MIRVTCKDKRHFNGNQTCLDSSFCQLNTSLQPLSCVEMSNKPDEMLVQGTPQHNSVSHLALFQTKFRHKLSQLAFKPACFVPKDRRFTNLELRPLQITRSKRARLRRKIFVAWTEVITRNNIPAYGRLTANYLPSLPSPRTPRTPQPSHTQTTAQGRPIVSKASSQNHNTKSLSHHVFRGYSLVR